MAPSRDEHEQIEQRVAALLRRRDRHGVPVCAWQRLGAEAPAAKVHEYLDDPGVVQECRVGYAFSVQVGPCEAARARDGGKRDRAA